MSKTPNQLVSQMTLEQLAKAERRNRRSARLWLVAIVVLFTLGLWVDWRFLPMMLVPFPFFCVSIWVGTLVQNEAHGRGEDARCTKMLLDEIDKLATAAQAVAWEDPALRQALKDMSGVVGQVKIEIMKARV